MPYAQKAALVWPGAPEGGVHGKGASVGLTAGLGPGGLGNVGAGGSARPVSPNSGLVHWVSMMADHGHVPSPAHSGPAHPDAVHYGMWNNNNNNNNGKNSW